MTHGSIGTRHPQADAAVSRARDRGDAPRPVGWYGMGQYMCAGGQPALRDVQPTEQEQHIRGWQLADKASKGGQAPRDVQQVRPPNRALNDGTLHNVSEDGTQIVRQHSHEAMTQQHAFRRLLAIRDSA